MTAGLRNSTAVVTVSLVLVGLVSSTVGASAASPRPPRWVLRGPYAPTIDPADFVATVDNPYFPLVPGTAFHFRGVSDRTAQTDDMVVTQLTKHVLGVTCTVVRDTVSEHGKAIERTFDWYAQDKRGNVWYMGEKSLERKNGRFVLASDSWQAGVKGGKPGIIMRGNPRPGAVYRQEYYRPGGALDQARVLGRSGSLRVPAGTYKRPLVTIEWSPVEPQLEKKWYVAGVGEIMEQVVAGGHEQFQLVEVTR